MFYYDCFGLFRPINNLLVEKYRIQNGCVHSILRTISELLLHMGNIFGVHYRINTMKYYFAIFFRFCQQKQNYVRVQWSH